MHKHNALACSLLRLLWVWPNQIMRLSDVVICPLPFVVCRLLWGKHEGDGMQLTLVQSMTSGFSAACLGPCATGPFDVIKVLTFSILLPTCTVYPLLFSKHHLPSVYM